MLLIADLANLNLVCVIVESLFFFSGVILKDFRSFHFPT